MRVLVATPLNTDESGGPARHLEMMLEELPKQGIKVSAISFKDFRKEKNVLRHYKFMREIIRQSKKVDLIYALDAGSVGFPAAVASWFARKRFIVRIPGIHAWEQGVQQCGIKENLDEFVASKKWRGFKIAIWLRMQRYVMKRALKIVVPSDYMRGIVIQLGAQEHRVRVVYSSFESHFDLSILDRPRPGNYIVSIGRVVPWKGYRTLVEIMPAIREQIPDAKLVVIGEGPEKEELANHARTLGLGDSVTFTGELSPENVRMYLARAKLFALNTGYEGFSHTILEAMDAGLPVVTTNVGGNPELVIDGKNGRLVPHEDREQLQAAIIELLSNEEKARNFAAASKESIGCFAGTQAAKQIGDILRQRLVLMLSSDRKIFENGSLVRQRMKDYASMVEELHIIVFATCEHTCPETEAIGDNLFTYSTMSKTRWWYVWDSIMLGRTFTDIDLITCQDPFESGLAGWVLAKLFGAKLSLQVHTDITSYHYEEESRLNWFRMKIARFTLKRADCVRVVAERIAEWLKEYLIFPNPVVLPIFTDVEAMLAKTNLHAFGMRRKYPHFTGPIVLWVGRFEVEKDCATALKAFKKFLETYPDAGMLILGEGRLEIELRILSRVLGIPDRVEFVGFETDISQYYFHSDMLLATSRYEGYGRMLVEAAAYSLPMVSTDVGIIGSWFKEGEHTHVCPVGDTDCLADSMRMIAQYPDEAKVMGERAHARLQEVHIPTQEEYLAQMRETFETCGVHK